MVNVTKQKLNMMFFIIIKICCKGNDENESFVYALHDKEIQSLFFFMTKTFERENFLV